MNEISSFITMAVWYDVLRLKMAFIAETCCGWLIINQVVYRLDCLIDYCI